MGIYQGEIDLYQALEGLPKLPHLEELLQSDKMNAAIVGGQGSAKTVGLCVDCILNAYAEPNGFSLMGRLNMPALESTTMKTFLELIPETFGEWHDTKKLFRFENNHEVIFKHLDITDPKVAGHVRSLNLSRAYVDEACEISEETYFLLIGRLRRQTAVRRGIRLASNPAGHDWMWRHFFDPARKQELQNSNLGITASTLDNPFLPTEYVQNMINTYPDDWAARFIHGSFADFSDLVYKEFSEQTHVWNAKKSWPIFGNKPYPPMEWGVIIGIDIGSDVDPWAIAIDSVAPNGMLFQYAEVYGKNMLIADIAKELHAKIGERKILGIAYDYANRQAALELAEHDINGQPAEKEVLPGLFKMAQYYHIDPRLDHPFDSRQKGSPRAFISSDCANAIRETGAYKWEKTHSGIATGEPSHVCSHSPDSRRYSVHTFRPLPEKLPVPKKWQNPDLDALSREYWRDEEKFRDRHDRLAKFKPGSVTPKTIQEWQKLASATPRRFIRPSFAKYSRVC